MRWLCYAVVGFGWLAGAATPGDCFAPSLPVGDKDKTPPDLRTRKTGSDWPHFLGPTRDGVSTEKGPLTPWPARGPRVVWEKAVGSGYGAPAVSRGRLFLLDRHGDNARLTCLKSETGEFLWKFEYPSNYRDKYGYNNGPRCCPVVDDDRVYTFGAEGMLHCVRAVDGKLVWKVDTMKEFGVVQNFFGVTSAPVVEGDLLIAMVGGSPKGSDKVDFEDLKGNGSGVVAFNKYTGKVRYSISDELASCASPVLATINGRRWGFVLARGGLIGFEPGTGKVDFHFPWRAEAFESANASNPVVVGDRVFISECYGPGSALLKVKPGGYDVVWSDEKKPARDKSLQVHWMTPIHHDGYLYGCSGRHKANADLRCVELATGKVMWSVPRLSRTSLLMVDGHFVCQTEVGPMLLMKVNPRKFEPVKLVELKDAKGEPLLDEPCWAAPVLSNGLMYVRGEDRLVCVEVIPAK
jgi:outer membrane protein assembly factor BamB